MSNSKQDNHNHSTSNPVDKEAIMNLANNLVKKEHTIDMSSIMRMAANLLNDDSLMNSVKDLGKYQAAPLLNKEEVQENTSEPSNAVWNEQLEELADKLSDFKLQFAASVSDLQTQLFGELSEMKKEIQKLQEENTKLSKQITYIEQNYKPKKKN